MLDAQSLDTIFRRARTHNAIAGALSDAPPPQLYDLMKWGPTASNTQPGRILFVRSREAKVMPRNPRLTFEEACRIE